jgi:hypothetical protein
MSEPDAAVVGVVFFFSSNVSFHRPVADDIGAGGGLDGVEVWEAVVGAEGGDEVFAVVEFDGLIFLREDELGVERRR